MNCPAIPACPPSAAGTIGDLVLVLRGLLIEHRLQASGDCQVCTSAWPPDDGVFELVIAVADGSLAGVEKIAERLAGWSRPR